MDDPDRLTLYRQKRDFTITPEPAGGGKTANNALAFVVQKHWARNLHYDFRLEFEGTLRSWAVPKGPSLDPHQKRMAVQVEDHPLAYGSFEGSIPADQYGAGRVIVWDSGVWIPTIDPVQGFKDGKLKFELRGQKLLGKWTLIRIRGDGEKQTPWLLIKEHDGFERPSSEYSITEALPDSINSAARATATRKVKPVAAASKIAGKSARPNLKGMPPEAVKAELPAKLAPQLATLADGPPSDVNWLYELKFDGYRLLTRADKGAVQCFTRNGHDWTAKLPQLARALEALQLTGTWLDGEIVVLNSAGIPDFQLLQNAFDTPRRNAGAMPAVIYYVFDIPFYRGYDLRNVPLMRRRALLEGVLGEHPVNNILFSSAFDAPCKELKASACKLGLEGLIAKRADSPYQSRRSNDWIKLKCGARETFLICGYTEPKGARSGLGALLLGHYDDSGELLYAGSVGSGFSDATLTELTRVLQKSAISAPPFRVEPSIAGKPHWVKPTLSAEVSFAERTKTGRIRHGVFRGLANHPKHPLPAPKASKQKQPAKPPAPLKAMRSAEVILPASLRITHPERVIDVQSGLSKIDVIKHYAAVSTLILPHLKHRPVSLVRAPAGTAGELFFQKHAKAEEIPGIKLLDQALDPGHASLLEISNLTGLLNAAQMNTLEFHSWNGIATAIDKPDRMIFDLDPGDKVTWPQMQEAALLMRTLLDALALKPFLKTSGGKGLHVVVPLKKQFGWDAVKAFSQAVVQHLAKTIPQKFVAKSGPKNRVGKIFVDYLRNGFGATTVCAWSARARPGLGVSVPLAWDELATLTSSAHWTIENIAERVNVGNSPWDGYAKSACGLKDAAKLLGYKWE